MTAKKYLPILCCVSLWCLFSGCHNLGEEKTYNGVRLYHNAPVTDDEAEALGNYLVSSWFADGTEKTVQINKNGDTYQFRFVIKDNVKKDYAKNIKLFAAELSNDIFKHAPVEVDACDQDLKTVKAFPYVDLGKKKLFDGVELFYTNSVKPQEADTLGNYLVKSEFANGEQKITQLTKTGNVYQFRFVGTPGSEKNPAIVGGLIPYAIEISQKVFAGAPVEIQLCDAYLNTLGTTGANHAQSTAH